MMPLWADIALGVLLVAGSVIALIGSIGLATLTSFYQRLHGPTKASTLGLGCTLLASILLFSVSHRSMSVHELLITGFVFLTAPISAHMLIRAVLASHAADETLPPVPSSPPASTGDAATSSTGINS
jgi:multicomponent K+:H+ antiporter subunit G